MPVQHQAAAKIQHAFRQWQVNESALFHCGTAVSHAPDLTKDSHKLLDVCANRKGHHFWHVDDYTVSRFAPSSSALDAPRSESHKLRKEGIWRRPRRRGEKGQIRSAIRPWLFASTEAKRRQAAQDVFNPKFGMNCYGFVLTSLYAARLTSRGAVRAALTPPEKGVTRIWKALGSDCSKSISRRTPHAGDILFYAADNVVWHVLIAAQPGKAYELGSTGDTAFRVRCVDIKPDGSTLYLDGGNGNTRECTLKVRVTRLRHALYSLRKNHREVVGQGKPRQIKAHVGGKKRRHHDDR